MIKWLKKLFHIHEYEIIDTYEVSIYDDGYSTRPSHIRRTYVLRCKICGDITFKQINL